ncbi:MAG TPA: PilZ domain-containing protein [Vicinamibacterales bacterium]|nr:PilZ domain-containing protein [Vicinamibacterales bacterium]
MSNWKRFFTRKHQSAQGSDRRRNERVPTRLPADVEAADGRRARVVITDVSRDGVQLSLDVADGTLALPSVPLKIELIDPFATPMGSGVHAVGNVAYRRAGSGSDVRAGVELDADAFMASSNRSLLFPVSPESDAEVQRLIEQLTLELPGNTCRVIVLTSVSPLEGVARIAQWLSIALARQADQRVLYVDADSVHAERESDEGAKNFHGLLDVAEGTASVSSVIRRTPLDNLHVMRRGGLGADALLRVSEDRLKKAIDELRTDYNYVVIAASPVGDSPFSFVLARNTDGAFLVVSVGASTKAAVMSVVDRLGKYGGRLLGVVVNNGGD